MVEDLCSLGEDVLRLAHDNVIGDGISEDPANAAQLPRIGNASRFELVSNDTNDLGRDIWGLHSALD